MNRNELSYFATCPRRPQMIPGYSRHGGRPVVGDGRHKICNTPAAYS